MNSTIKISIPTPCHENWAAMTPVDKGRFCASCQKKVFDFTQATDREIYAAFKKTDSLCGRFNENQLDRELTFRENANRKWINITAAFLGFIALNSKTYAQKATTHKAHVSVPTAKKVHSAPLITIQGKVTDTLLAPLKDVFVGIKGTSNNAVTDSTGVFSIKGKKGDILVLSVIGYKTKEVVLGVNTATDFILTDDEGVNVTAYTKRCSAISGGAFVVVTSKRKTFFGRIIEKIGNIF